MLEKKGHKTGFSAIEKLKNCENKRRGIEQGLVGIHRLEDNTA